MRTMLNKKQKARLGGPAGLAKSGASEYGYHPILSARPFPVNQRLRDLRRKIEERLDQAEIDRDWPTYRKFYRAYLAIVDAEIKRGQL